jgi:hypothetical protein
VLIAILPWYYLSELKFLADMGLLLVMVMLINMVVALIVLPLEVWVIKPRFMTIKGLLGSGEDDLFVDEGESVGGKSFKKKEAVLVD